MHAGMCLELENAREAVTSVMSQRAADAADAAAARAAAGREISALTGRAEELAAHLEAACSENAALSTKLKELAADNASLQVARHFSYDIACCCPRQESCSDFACSTKAAVSALRVNR